jgi:putative hydrolase of the HAD superfamily
VSIVADFARSLHESQPKPLERPLTPVLCRGETAVLPDIRVAIIDVYGTMINYWKETFKDETQKQASLLAAFKKTAEYFKLSEALKHADPESPPELTLCNLYHGLISLKQGLANEAGAVWPEIKIETVWEAILLICKRHGYDSAACKLGADSDLCLCMAYYYNFFAINRSLYPGLFDALRAMRDKNILLGILSNAQFYTPIDLTLLLRDQSNGALDDASELFENDLTFYSYEYGVAKPDTLLFRKLFDALYEYQVLPGQTVFVGNDMANDIAPAQKAGLKTALFTGDDRSLFNARDTDTAAPDLFFEEWNLLPDTLSFHGGK